MNASQSMHDQLLEKVHHIIEDHLGDEDFSVEKLARLSGLSRSMLHRKLTMLTGQSASDLITEKRLIRARNLLENNVATVSEIAYQVGFSSPSYFNKVFKRHFKVPPGEVRKGALRQDETHPVPQEPRSSSIFISKKYRQLLYGLSIVLFLAITGWGINHFSRNRRPAEKSIAVLPFVSLTSEQENQFFADAIADDLLSKLSTIHGLKVISRTSSEVYRERGKKTIPQIADELGVSYIIEGSVQREKSRTRITIQLIDARLDDHIWSKLYDSELDDLFTVQSEIALKVASELNTVLTQQQISSIRKNFTNSTRAFELYQLGRISVSQRTLDGYKKGIEYYEQAIALDRNYGLAYAGLSDIYHLLALQFYVDLQEGTKKARELSLKALELDPDLAEAYAVLGSLDAYLDWNWDLGEEELLQAIRLNPNYSTAYQYYSEVLLITGRNKEAREYIERALELDPFSFVIRYISSEYYYFNGEFPKALEETKLCLNLVDDHLWALRMQFFVLFKLKMDQEALATFKRYISHNHLYPVDLVENTFENEGLDGLVRLVMTNEPDQAARWHLVLGEYTEALDLLETLSTENRVLSLRWIRGGFSAIHSDPRYIGLLNKMGLKPL